MRRLLFLFLFVLLPLFGCANSEKTSGEVTKENNETVVKSEVAYLEDRLEATTLYENEIYGFTVSFPNTWDGKYEVEESEEATKFFYKSQVDGRAELVTIYVVDETEWEQDEYGQLRYLATSNGSVYYFVLPLDVPYSNENEIKEYSQMVVEARTAMSTFQLRDAKISGSPMVALDLFFRGFQTENYELAAQFYGGEYEWIYEKVKQYREVSLEDSPGILRGFIEELGGEVTYISEVHEIKYIDEHDWYQFLVSLVTDDGKPYVSFGDEGPLAFHVKAIDGTFKVLDLPSITLK
ncbi:hypothetical protein DS745_11205 [Anaerobacillus alkaliphilus]|uniref:Uncharacterized protein n=1 Tax=Anaerobacillus alkaliphilus TaxID=1548597 RepID=A0A4Q0VSW6_9BACI|nr:hypothetical protein [Anaerobacillus alkaliphilus]RXJ00625.1 hypothetical protein DS745_11205 [Anaerobacillus alkaliphilus]